MKSVVSLMGACCLMSFTLATAADSGIVTTEWVFEEAPFPECHASTLVETERGLTIAWFGGTYEKHPDVGIWISRKVKNSWSAPIEVANGVQSETTRFPCWNPVLFNAGEKGLLLFYKVGPSPEKWWGMLTVSNDQGATWEKPTRLPTDILGPIKNKPVLLKDGRLICGSSTEHDGWRVHMEWTTDLGSTWERSSALSLGGAKGAIQPTVLVHGKGDSAQLQILCRSRGDGKILESWSANGGRDWSELKATSLPNPNSGIDAVTLRDGRQLLIYNHTRTGRSPLNLAISNDGKSWSAVAKLETEPGEYSYPAIIQTNDAMVHISYTWKRKRIRHVVCDPSKFDVRAMVEGKWPD